LIINQKNFFGGLKMEKTTEKKNNFSGLLPTVAVSLVIGVVIGWLLSSAIANPASNNGTISGMVVLPSNNVGDKTINYLNENFLKAQGVEAKLGGVEPYGDALYMVSLDVYKDGNKLQSTNVFATRDGNLVLLQSPLNLNEKIPAPTTTQTPQEFSYKDVVPAAKAELDAFIVSRCPYGLQMQRILAPIATGLSDNITVRYIGSIENGKIVSMHGDEEAQENLRQICIREEQSSKYWPYVSEYMKKGDTEAALTAVGIDKTKLSACMSDATKGLKYAQADFDLANSNGVSGSPTLFLNGSQVSEYEFAADHDAKGSERSAENVKNLLCYGFTTQPAACSATLSKENANTGLSEQYSGGATTGGTCG
jgi:hypothetical protein